MCFGRGVRLRRRGAVLPLDAVADGEGLATDDLLSYETKFLPDHLLRALPFPGGAAVDRRISISVRSFSVMIHF